MGVTYRFPLWPTIRNSATMCNIPDTQICETNTNEEPTRIHTVWKLLQHGNHRHDLPSKGNLMDSFNSALEEISGWVWGPWCLIPLLFITGVVLTWRLRGIQVTKLIPALRLGLFERHDKDAEGGDVSQFQALTTALAATVGTGNIVGVATAVLMGGPGAIFWMWISGFFGMASKYSEAFLAVRYRTRDEKGEISGGPQYYLQRGIKGPVGKVLALTFSVFAVLASFGIGNMTQANSISANMEGTFHVPTWVTGVVLAILALLVLVGGIKSIGKVTESFVPLMILVYVLTTIVLLVLNAGQILPAFGLIFSDAFTGQAVAGGALGTVIRFGMARGIFSNESGMGSAAIAATAADHSSSTPRTCVHDSNFHRHHDCSDLHRNRHRDHRRLEGCGQEQCGNLTGTAFDTSLPGQWGSIIVTLCLAMFAFSTILGWCYYGERNVERLVGVKWVLPYRIIFSLVVFVGATTSLSVVWNVADILNGLMAIPNLIGLLVLSGLIARETEHYLDNDPELRASKQEIDTFMEGRPGAIDTYETDRRLVLMTTNSSAFNPSCYRESHSRRMARVIASGSGAVQTAETTAAPAPPASRIRAMSRMPMPPIATHGSGVRPRETGEAIEP